MGVVTITLGTNDIADYLRLQCLSAVMGVVTYRYGNTSSPESGGLQCLSAVMGVVTQNAICRWMK